METSLEIRKPPAQADDGPLRSLLGLGGAVAGIALRPVKAGIELGVRTERELRVAVVRQTSATVIGGLDAVLASPLAAEVVERVLTSTLARRTVGTALSGPLVEAAAGDLVRYGVAERVADELLAGETVDHLLDRAQAADLPRHVADRLLADGLLEQTVARVLDGPELERAVESALDSAAMERLVVRVIESRLLNEAVERLLQTDELWLIVDEIARSPSVADAITRQSAGFVDELADGVRTQSRSADTWLESRVRNVFGRKPRPAQPGEG
jgi:hypothetical protein